MIRRRYVIGVGLCAIIASLLTNLYLQYTSLAALKEASPIARTVLLEQRLNDVAADIDTQYREMALSRLAVSSSAIKHEGVEDDVEAGFAASKAEGVKYYFIGSPYKNGQVKITLYDPAERSIVRPLTPEGWIALSGSTALFSLIMRRSVVDPAMLITAEDDPDNPVVVRPIVDDASRIVGVAGMIVDIGYFKGSYLPEALPATLARHFQGNEIDGLAFTVYDDKKNAVFGEGRGVEAWVPLQFAFSKWRLAAGSLGVTHTELAGRSFSLNLSLTVLNTVVLLCAMAFALRTASREMKLSQMKSDFVSNVSHELRTPLSSIRVLGEFLRSGRKMEPEKLRKYGEYIETEGVRLTQLINNILDFSKIESGQRTYSFEETDLARVVESALREFEIRLVQSGFEVELRGTEQPLPDVAADRGAMTQVIANLIDNAMKYSGESKRIAVELGRQDNFVVVSVQDFGIGISADEIPRIFDRFHRVSTGLVHNVKGSGLGLTLVKHIVEAHKGRVTVASEPGRGSTFTVCLPALVDAGAHRAPHAAARAHDDPHSHPGVA